MQNKKFLLGIAIILLFYIFFIVVKWQQNNPRNFTIDKTTHSNLLKELRDIDHVRGSKDPDILLIVYSDFECPFCKKFNPEVEKIVKEYNATWVFRHFPLPFHQRAQKESEASECVAELGGNDKFWEFHDLLFQRTKSGGLGFSIERLAPLAEELGVDKEKVQQCIDSDKFADRVKKDLEGGQQLGINGTPSTLIISKNGKRQLVVGALEYQSLKDIIDSLLK